MDQSAPFLDNPYFKRSEFACKCGCGLDNVDHGLVELLTTIRGVVAKPIIITSGLRCINWNRANGGSEASYHLSGQAADFYVKDMDIGEVHNLIADCIDQDKYGLGYYPAKKFIHLYVRNFRARWMDTE